MRLTKLLPKIISLEQGGFVPQRETSEGAIVAHEVLHSISTQKYPTMILKLDMMKAYDRVEWNVLKFVLSRLGFSLAWIKWIMSCISSARFSVLVNGSPFGFFHSSRGLRQGDPLSPFLFILLSEALSWAIRSVRVNGLWKGIKIQNFDQRISHRLFADDTLLFGSASLKEDRVIDQVVRNYVSFSSQKVNKDTSKIFFLNTHSLIQDKL